MCACVGGGGVSAAACMCDVCYMLRIALLHGFYIKTVGGCRH